MRKIANIAFTSSSSLPDLPGVAGAPACAMPRVGLKGTILLSVEGINPVRRR